MDILSLGKANKAKRAIKKVNDRIGSGVGLSYGSAKKRIEFLESKDPKVNPMARVSALEANTHINLNKHNLRVEMLMNKSRFNLKDAVVDDLEDAVGMDLAASVNVTHDQTNHLVKVTNVEQQGILMFKKETIAAPAFMFTVSIVSSKGIQSQEDPVIELKENDGSWLVVNKDDMTYARAGKEWVAIEIRVTLKNDQQLNAIAYSWT